MAKMTEEEYVAFVEAERAKGADLGPYSVLPCDCDHPNCLGWRMAPLEPPWERFTRS